MAYRSQVTVYRETLTYRAQIVKLKLHKRSIRGALVLRAAIRQTSFRQNVSRGDSSSVKLS